MFRRFNPVLRLFAKRGSSGAPQSNARRTLVLAALMALALVNLTGEAAATSAGCTAFNNATLDSGSSNYTTARNTFQAGDTLHVDGPAGNSIFFNADSTVGYQPLPFNYNVQASDITSGTSSISGYFTFYYTDGPTTEITLSCVPAPAGRAQRISLSGLNQATTVTVGTPTSFSASSTSGLPSLLRSVPQTPRIALSRVLAAPILSPLTPLACAPLPPPSLAMGAMTPSRTRLSSMSRRWEAGRPGRRQF